MKNAAAIAQKFEKKPTENQFISGSEQHRAVLLSVKRALTVRKYSPRTVQSYCNHLSLFFAFFPEKSPDFIREEAVETYLFQQTRRRGWAEATQHQALNAIRFFFEAVLNRPANFSGLRPKTKIQAPLVLSRAEVVRIFQSLSNVKHRSMLMLLYSAGLRLSELTGLRRKDIQFDEKRIFIKGPSKKKDRFSLLSEKTAACLREYFHEYRAGYWLYEGRNGGRYSARSVEAVFQKALKKSGIQTPATVRTLRHSFAAHLVENGAGLQRVQALLGHESAKATGMYALFFDKTTAPLISPLDFPEL